jgi:hypothetical protein
MTPTITREDAERMALEFLREGPHTMPNPLETEAAICACLMFMDLEKRGLVSRTDFGGGNVQFALKPAGLAVIS